MVSQLLHVRKIYIIDEVFMEILLVLINCSLLIFTFFFLGRWLIRPFNKKYLYIYDPDTDFRERIYKIKEI